MHRTDEPADFDWKEWREKQRTRSGIKWPVWGGDEEQPFEKWLESGPVSIQVDWELIDGEMGAASVTVRPTGDRALTASELHSLPFGSIFALTREKAMQLEDADRAVSPEEQAERIERWSGAGRTGRKPTYDLAHYAKVAEVYRSAAVAGQRPGRAVASEFDVTATTARNWVARCRKLGLLDPPPGPGKAGG